MGAMQRRVACWWLLRLHQRVSDLATVAAFSLFPIAPSTSMYVKHVVLQIQQWRGSIVGSGGYIWGGSRRLAHYLEAHGDGSPATLDSCSVPSRHLQTLTLLELGSGTCAVGLAAAILGADVTITDQTSFVYPKTQQCDRAPHKRGPYICTLLDLAKVNVATSRGALAGGAPVVMQLLWGDKNDEAALPHIHYDIICGGDILFFTGAHAALLCSLRSLSLATTVALFEHTDLGVSETDYPPDLSAFFRAVELDGLWLPTIVRDHGRHITLRMVHRDAHRPEALAGTFRPIAASMATKSGTRGLGTVAGGSRMLPPSAPIPVSTTSRCGPEYGDSPEAVRAHQLFLRVATPAAASTLTTFLIARGTPEEALLARTLDEWDLAARTLDEFLLDELHGTSENVFAMEWKAFARDAARRGKSSEVTRAWKQWQAFGGTSCAAACLEPVVEHQLTSGVVRTIGVARVHAALSPLTVGALRAHILLERDNGIQLAAHDDAAEAQLFSRVLSPRDAEMADCKPAVITRWDVRLAWEPVVRAAVLEVAGGVLGDAFCSLCGGDAAELFECAAIISTAGAAPQILHSDTIFTPTPQLFTAFVALQDISPNQGPTRFIPGSHDGERGALAHRDLAEDVNDETFCKTATSTSVLALLSAGDASIFDSRLLHCGGPHLNTPPMATSSATEALELPVDRVLFYISFRHVLAATDLSNADIHGAGSIRPELSSLKLRLGELRKHGQDD